MNPVMQHFMHQALITTIPLDGEANNNNSLWETTTKRRGILCLQAPRQNVRSKTRRHGGKAVRPIVLANAGGSNALFGCMFFLERGVV